MIFVTAGEEGAARAHSGPCIILLSLWLMVLTRFCEEEYDLLVGFTAYIDCSMRFQCWLVPVNLAFSCIELAELAAVSEFDSESLATKYHRYPAAGVRMPGGRFPRAPERLCEPPHFFSCTIVLHSLQSHFAASCVLR